MLIINTDLYYNFSEISCFHVNKSSFIILKYLTESLQIILSLNLCGSQLQPFSCGLTPSRDLILMLVRVLIYRPVNKDLQGQTDRGFVTRRLQGGTKSLTICSWNVISPKMRWKSGMYTSFNSSILPHSAPSWILS